MISAGDIHCDEVTDLILAEEQNLRRVARRLVRNDADVDDLVQDALMRAYRARDRFEIGTSVRAWTSTILRRVHLTSVMRSRRRKLENDTDVGGVIETTCAGATHESAEVSPAFTALLERLDDPVRRALLRVPEVYLEPFILASIQELSCADIAQRLGIPEGTVMSRIHRARERMKRDLGHDESATPRTDLRLVRGPRSGSGPRAVRPIAV